MSIRIEFEIERVRKELHEYIQKYELTDDRTVRKSQELDVLLNCYGQTICA